MRDNEKLARVREALGYSATEMGTLLGLKGLNVKEHVRAMERGAAEKPVSAPISMLLDYIAQGLVLSGPRQDSNLATSLVPRFMSCTDLAGETSAEVIMHTRWPRFYGRIVNDRDVEAIASVGYAAADVQLVKLPAELGDGTMAVMFIDKPERDARLAIDEAIELLKAKAR